jgi:hypothetical protein
VHLTGRIRITGDDATVRDERRDLGEDRPGRVTVGHVLEEPQHAEHAVAGGLGDLANGSRAWPKPPSGLRYAATASRTRDAPPPSNSRS